MWVANVAIASKRMIVSKGLIIDSILDALQQEGFGDENGERVNGEPDID
jgi:hypothetical protein